MFFTARGERSRDKLPAGKIMIEGMPGPGNFSEGKKKSGDHLSGKKSNESALAPLNRHEAPEGRPVKPILIISQKGEKLKHPGAFMRLLLS